MSPFWWDLFIFSGDDFELHKFELEENTYEVSTEGVSPPENVYFDPTFQV